MDKEKK